MPKLYKAFSKILLINFIFSYFSVNVFGLGTLLPTKYIPTVEQAKSVAQDETNGGSKLMQFSSDGNILGFDVGSVYIASGSHSLKVDFVNGNNVKPIAENGTTSLSNLSDTNGALPLGKVTYKGVWDNIDIVYSSNKGGIAESSYYLNNTPQKDANVENIRLHYNTPVSIDKQGNLVTTFETGTITESSPIAWQMIDGVRKSVDVNFVLYSENEVGFKLGNYVFGIPVTIDPTISWQNFIGTSVNDMAYGIAVDSNGNSYVTGYSSATWGSPKRLYTAGLDVFVAKYNSSGTLQWNTFLGGLNNDYGFAITIDSSGNSYITGIVASGASGGTWGSPVNPITGVLDEIFVAKLNSSGVLSWNTFLGSSNGDEARAIALDSSNNIYIVGSSSQTWGSPVRAHEASVGYDIVVAKINGTSGILIWNTFLGGVGSDVFSDYGYGISVYSSSVIYVTGASTQTWGSPLHAYTSGYDIDLVKLGSTGAVAWNTFYGGSGNDYGTSMTYDSSGNLYIGGNSDATWGSPINPFFSGIDVVIAKFNSSGSLTWNTFLGGIGTDQVRSIDLDSNNNIFIGGASNATWGSPLRSYSSDYDGTISELNNSGTLQWNTFLGGSGIDHVYSIGLSSNNNLYAAGDSNATWGSPTNLYSGAYDGFVTNISGLSTGPTFSSITGSDTTWYNTPRSAVITAQQGSSSIVEIRYNWGSNAMNTACTTGGTVIANGGTTATSTAGDLTLYACVRDTDGNYFATSQANYRWENTPPSTPTAPSGTFINGKFVNDDFTLSTTSSDTGGSGLSSYTLFKSDDYVTGGTHSSNFTSIVNQASNSYLLTLTKRPANGMSADYYWTATDSATNTSFASATTEVAMDTSAPTTAVTIANFTYDNTTWVTSNTINGSSSDSIGSGVSTVEITIYNDSNSEYWTGSTWTSTENWLPVSSGTTTWTYSLDNINLIDSCQYTIKARATDAIGNTTLSGFGTDSFVYFAGPGLPDTATPTPTLTPTLTPTNTPTPTLTPSDTPVPTNTPTLTPTPDVVIEDNTFTDVIVTNPVGIVTVGIATFPANIPIALVDIDTNLISGDLVLENLTAETSGTRSVLHYPGGIGDLPGSGGEFVLFVPKGDGNSVLICPGATSLNDVILGCVNGYYLDEYAPNVTISIIHGVDYWRVTGLTGTGGMSVVYGVNDTLSRLQVNEYADHRINFKTNYGIAVGENFVVSFDPSNKTFDLSGLTISDIVLSDSGSNNRTLGSTAGPGTWGVNINTGSDTLTFTAPTDNVGIYDHAKIVLLEIGGLNKIKNPSVVSSVQETITINNYRGEEGTVSIPIIDSDTIDITGYVSAFIHFDIDTNTDNTDCAYNVCKVHGGFGAATGGNYTVDLGELTSAVVNKSMTTSKHSDGLNGLINSIFFDLTTNAPAGAVVTVKSTNGGLQGPGTNMIPSIGITVGADGITRYDGEDIPANSGVYGYNLPVASTALHGTVLPNSLCDSLVKFCGAPSTTPKTVFTTNNLPIDTARVRMDLAAAANYTNNPGVYTDTLTFVATSTF